MLPVLLTLYEVWKTEGRTKHDQTLKYWSFFMVHCSLQPGHSVDLRVMEFPSLCSLVPVLPLKLLHKHTHLKGEAVIQEVS